MKRMRNSGLNFEKDKIIQCLRIKVPRSGWYRLKSQAIYLVSIREKSSLIANYLLFGEDESDIQSYVELEEG